MRRYLIGTVLGCIVVYHAAAQKAIEIPKDWKSINGCGVTLSVPADVVFVKDESVDTCERNYRGRNTSIHITATEWNVGRGDHENWPDHCVAKISINGKKAEIVTSFIPISYEENKGRDFSSLLLIANFFPDGRDLRIRTLSTEKDRRDAIAMLKSVRPESK